MGGTKYYYGDARVPPVICLDGFSMSVQAGGWMHSSPKIDFADYYFAVEIGFPSQVEEFLLEYAEKPDEPTDTVYGYVPVELIDAIIKKHGGIVNG